MSNQNNRTRRPKNPPVEKIVEETPAEVIVDQVPIEETKEEPVVDTIPAPAEPVYGTVFNCTRLNLRANPNVSASILCKLEAGTTVMVDLSDSIDGWYNVYTTDGIKGYCMKEYIQIKA